MTNRALRGIELSRALRAERRQDASKVDRDVGDLLLTGALCAIGQVQVADLGERTRRTFLRTETNESEIALRNQLGTRALRDASHSSISTGRQLERTPVRIGSGTSSERRTSRNVHRRAGSRRVQWR
jgi:hypothetical protein